MENRYTRPSSTSLIENSEPIPDDVIIEILSRLPSKSVVRNHCLSNQWASILCRPDFTNLFLTMSLARPRLLFTFKAEGKWLFFSAPQTLNPDQNSSHVVADKHMCFPTNTCSFQIHGPVRGLLCAECTWLIRGSDDSKAKIYNPSTGEFITLPKVRTRRVDVRTYFGYDPINKQYKVLCMSVCRKPHRAAEEHQVLTLGTEKLSWRMIECSLPHFPMSARICINGVLYYLADKGSNIPNPFIVVCFDVKSEKFKFIDHSLSTWPSSLINYAGKLGVLQHEYTGSFSGRTTSLKLWVLDDVDKQKWSQHIYVLPPLWKNLVGDRRLDIVGMTSNSEIVFSPPVIGDPFYIFYYNVKNNIVKRATIQGIRAAFMGQPIRTFMDHVENLNREWLG